MSRPHAQRSIGRLRGGHGSRQTQRGLVLLVVMVVLALMFLAGLGVMRAADTGNVISGNFSFQQSAMQASDRAITDALTGVANQVVAGGGNNAVANQYLPRLATTGLDSRGVPGTSSLDAAGASASIDWSSVPCSDEKGVAVTNCAVDAGNYRVQYVIERRCASNPNLTDINDIRAKCEYEPSATALTPTTIGVRYRVLIRVRGPRGTESWFESMLAGAATS